MHDHSFFGLEVLLQGNATPAPSVASWSPTSVAVGRLVDAFAVVQLVLYSGIAVVHDLGSSRGSAHCCSRTVWSAGSVCLLFPAVDSRLLLGSHDEN